MGKYKKYLLGIGDVPRRTAYRHRKLTKFCVELECTIPVAVSENGSPPQHLYLEILTQENLLNPNIQDEISDEMESTLEKNGMEANLVSTNGGIFEDDSSANNSSDDDPISTNVEVFEDDSNNDNEMDGTSQNCISSSPEDLYWKEESSDNHGVCPCAVSSAEEVMVMCLSLGLRFSMPWCAQEGILQLINAMYGYEKIPSSKYRYFQFIDKSGGRIKYHIMCSECEDYLGCKDDLDEKLSCSCGNEVTVAMSSSFFLSVDIAAQMKELLADDPIRDALLNFRFQRKKSCSESLEDIYDGVQYKKYFLNGGILSNPFNFSYSFNTDGVPMGKSSKSSIWPIYVTINELPLKMRNKHVLLAGLYVGPKDPDQNMFLQPFVAQANQLSTEGFTCVHNGESVVSKMIPMCAVVDSQARWKMLNMSGVNAYYACTFCYQKAVHARGEGQKFPPSFETVRHRTDASTRADMQKAFDRRNHPKPKKRIVKGVKGPSPLSTMFFFFNLISGFVPDYMHCILLGVARLHTELIFESQRKIKLWINIEINDRKEYIIGAVDERLLKIKSLSSITRASSLNQMKIWKESEWRAWLVFYAVPCLKGLRKSKYVEHFSVLSKATCLLLQKSISHVEVNEAHNLLLRYIFLFYKYFGLGSMKLNVHLLTHVAQGVLNWSHLWTHSAFAYEGENRFLLQFIHGSNEVCKQMARKFIISDDLPRLCAQNFKSKAVLRFCEKIKSKTAALYSVR